MTALLLQLAGLLAIGAFLFIVWPPLALGFGGLMALLIGLSIERVSNGPAESV